MHPFVPRRVFSRLRRDGLLVRFLFCLLEAANGGRSLDWLWEYVRDLLPCFLLVCMKVGGFGDVGPLMP